MFTRNELILPKWLLNLYLRKNDVYSPVFEFVAKKMLQTQFSHGCGPELLSKLTAMGSINVIRGIKKKGLQDLLEDLLMVNIIQEKDENELRDLKTSLSKLLSSSSLKPVCRLYKEVEVSVIDNFRRLLKV